MDAIRKITSNFSVTGQIRPEDVGTLAGQGYKVIINNRPDREEPGQVEDRRIADEAKIHRIAYFHIPVVTGQVTPQSLERFEEVLDTLPGPILAFCRSGTRSSMMWAMSKVSSMTTEDILKATSAAGYDLSGLAPELDELRAKGEAQRKAI